MTASVVRESAREVTDDACPVHSGSIIAGSYVRVQVKDSGPGLSLENIMLLFGQIIQFDAGKLQSGGGSGIGLFLSKGIMDLYGGHISVASAGAGLGSTFQIDIPIHEKESLDPSQNISQRSATPCQVACVASVGDQRASLKQPGIFHEWILQLEY